MSPQYICSNIFFNRKLFNLDWNGTLCIFSFCFNIHFLCLVKKLNKKARWKNFKVSQIKKLSLLKENKRKPKTPCISHKRIKIYFFVDFFGKYNKTPESVKIGPPHTTNIWRGCNYLFVFVFHSPDICLGPHGAAPAKCHHQLRTPTQCVRRPTCHSTVHPHRHVTTRAREPSP